ncbi:hypothetical protein Syun_029943 [Stephania yunnanensis]|uniref:Uncharacterized protein n=1 Tax=Stephania yunnanensis TaxID=152371 RepID=A0AAP0EEU8_9MAGN
MYNTKYKIKIFQQKQFYGHPAVFKGQPKIFFALQLHIFPQTKLPSYSSQPPQSQTKLSSYSSQPPQSLTCYSLYLSQASNLRPRRSILTTDNTNLQFLRPLPS